MMLYLVSYDLRNGTAGDYEELYREFETFSDSKRCLESSWLVATPLSCGSVRDRLYAHMKKGDHIVVVPYDEPRSSMLSSDVVQWIRKYLT